MSSKYANLMLLSLSLLQFTTANVVRQCPSKCTCDEWLLLRRANCTSVHTHSILTGVSDDVQALNLFNNSISSLSDHELMRAGLTQLRYLNLSFNHISEIAIKAFRKIQDLAVLDLSSNHLEYIIPETFIENTKLQVLKLNFNKFIVQVPQLRSSSITELGLQGCQINSIPLDTFKDLPKLETLDISHNLIRHLEIQVFVPTPDLKTIYFQENPWICDHTMRLFTTYLSIKKISFQKVCQLQKLDKMIMKGLEFFPEKSYKTSYDKDRMSYHAELSSLDILKKFIGANTTAEPDEVTVTRLKDMSPYWLVAIGFLLGSAVTIMMTYILLSTTISCFHPLNRRCLCDGTVDGVSQRVSLLHNFWQANGLDTTDSNQRPACPGTPPPPYREVMLHRNLYPNPSAVRLNNPEAACT